MKSFSRHISEARKAATRKPVGNAADNAAVMRRIGQEHELKQKVNPDGFGVTQHAVGHDEHDAAMDDLSPKQRRELERIRSKVWGVSAGSKPPELWAAGKGIPPDSGYSHISVKAMRRPSEENHLDYWSEIHDIMDMADRQEFPPLAFGRIDHARKLVSVTTFDERNMRAFGSSSVGRIWSELRRRFPNYSVVDLKWSG